MKQTDIEYRVDALFASKPTPTRKSSWVRTRKLMGIPVLPLLAVLGSAMLLSSLFTVFTVVMQGDIELTGTMKPLFSWDGQPFESEVFTAPMDIVDMTAGDDIVFTHTISNDDAQAWLITWDDSFMEVFENDTLHQWYGFYFTVENLMVNGVPVAPEDFCILPGDTASMDWRYQLDAEFVQPVDPLPFNVTVTLSRIDMSPVAVDDNAAVHYSESVDIPVLDNDFDPEGGDLEITSVGTLSGFVITVAGTYPNQYIHVVDNYASDSQLFHFDYTISDGVSSDTGTVHLQHTL